MDVFIIGRNSKDNGLLFNGGLNPMLTPNIPSIFDCDVGGFGGRVEAIK